MAVRGVAVRMPDDPCACRESTDRGTEGTATATDRWLTERPLLDAELPEDLQAGLGRFLGTEPIATLGDWATELRRRTGGAIAVEELCLADRETDHRGTVDGETYHFECFYDAILLAALEERPVDVRTKSPDGALVEARAVGTADLRVSPREAAFSFGIDEAVAPPSNDGPTLERGYAAICPYVRAFPTPKAYERWAGTVPAATVAMPLAGATELAAALVE